MSGKLEQLLRNNAMLWRGRGGERSGARSTGYVLLDEALPAGGWPVGSLVEVVVPRWGIGELQLWLPLLARLTQDKRFAVWLAPPHLPYAPALANAGVALDRVRVIHCNAGEREPLWSAERLLRTQACGVVLLWVSRLSVKDARRLQLAAATGQGVGVVFLCRDSGASPAALRLRLVAKNEGLQVEILKARGGFGAGSVLIPWGEQ